MSNITIVNHLFVPLRYLQFLKIIRSTAAAAAENEPLKVWGADSIHRSILHPSRFVVKDKRSMDSSDPTADPVDDGSSSSESEEKSVAASKDVSSIVSTRSAVQSEPARLIVDDKSTWEGVVIDDHATAAVTRKQKRSGLPFSIFIKARQVRMLDLGPYSVGEKYRARVFGTSVDVSFRDPSSLNVLLGCK